VLGEAILAATTAIQTGFDTGGKRGELLTLSVAGLVTVFGMWWIYFDRPGEELLRTPRSGFFFGYGHYFVFASAAAVGAGIAVDVDRIAGHAELTPRAAAFTVAIPVAIYIAGVWQLHRRPGEPVLRSVSFPVAAALVVITPLLPEPLIFMAGIVVVLVGTTIQTADPDGDAQADPASAS
jgi:low temperature requirement protein LtrA